MKEEDEEKIELRSEEFQEILGEIPHWILRWGIVLLSGIIALLLIGSYLFKYPDIIPAEVTVTTANPPAAIISRSSGKIKHLYARDKQQVHPGDYLAVIQNSASTEDIRQLRHELELLQEDTTRLFNTRLVLQLGDLQSVYVSFINTAQEYNNFRTSGYYEQKIAFQQTQIARYQNYYERMKRQDEITHKQHRLSVLNWQKDSLMYEKGAISGPERNNSQSAYLQSLQSLESSQNGLESQMIQIAQHKENLLDLQMEQTEKSRKLRSDFDNTREQLLTALKNWEIQYVLLSPIEGQVTFTSYWSENHTVNAGEAAFTVVPSTTETLVGKALLPTARSGKVKEGQKVNIRFSNYPDQEFGTVKGVVKSKSLVPVEGNYVIEITFPDGLKTNYKKILPLSQQMTGQADIITDDLRLIERFIQPIQKVLKNTQ